MSYHITVFKIFKKIIKKKAYFMVFCQFYVFKV